VWCIHLYPIWKAENEAQEKDLGALPPSETGRERRLRELRVVFDAMDRDGNGQVGGAVVEALSLTWQRAFACLSIRI